MAPRSRPVATNRRVWVVCAMLVVSGLFVASGAAAAGNPPLTTGFVDPLFRSRSASVRNLWLGRARRAGAGIVRIELSWAEVAPPSWPAGFEPGDPADPNYRWSVADGAVRDAAAHGLRIMLQIMRAPRWAEGDSRPKTAPSGTWKPDPQQFGAFAHAAAVRYSGTFPDPEFPGRSLPRVAAFELWNEPNQDYYLGPQYENGTLFMPYWYRAMVNRAYSGIKSAHSGALVVAPGTSPFGDPPGGPRTPPVVFLREMLCLRGGALKPVDCPEPAHFDVLSHHPIGIKPTEAALSPLDVSTPDLYKLKRILSKAERTGRVLPRRPKQFWATEFFWDTNPPDPLGVSLAKQARWIEQTFFLLWRQGVQVAINLPVRDYPPVPSYAFSPQSGIYFLDGRPKPSATAFRFPIVGRRHAGIILVWGIAPRRGAVQIQRKRGNRWTTVGRTQTSGAPHPFEIRIRAPRGGAQVIRARQGGAASLPWTQH